MIEISKLPLDFKQNGNSCVMAAYAVALNYFTAIEPSKSFDGYCDHYHLSNSERSAEQTFGYNMENGFHNSEGFYKGCLLVKNLHENSNYEPFITARRFFSAKFFDETELCLKELEDALEQTESLYMVGQRFHEGDGTHVITIGRSPEIFVLKDTNHDGLQHYQNLAEIPALKDGLLFNAI